MDLNVSEYKSFSWCLGDADRTPLPPPRVSAVSPHTCRKTPEGAGRTWLGDVGGLQHPEGTAPNGRRSARSGPTVPHTASGLVDSGLIQTKQITRPHFSITVPPKAASIPEANGPRQERRLPLQRVWVRSLQGRLGGSPWSRAGLRLLESSHWLLPTGSGPDRSTKPGQRRLNPELGPSRIFISKSNVRSRVL